MHVPNDVIENMFKLSIMSRTDATACVDRKILFIKQFNELVLPKFAAFDLNHDAHQIQDISSSQPITRFVCLFNICACHKNECLCIATFLKTFWKMVRVFENDRFSGNKFVD